MASALIAALTAAAAVTAAGTGIVGTSVASSNAAKQNKTMAETARNNQINAENQQQYQAALTAEAMKRATAGSVNGRGDQGYYDPATNTWRTMLSPNSAAIQSQGDAFTKQNQKDVTSSNALSLLKSGSDFTNSNGANTNALLEAIRARPGAESARQELERFQPMSSGDLEGALQESATTANRQAQDPIIADTLRAFARSGTAAGPVLTNMMRDNATTLRQTVLGDKIAALKSVGDVNASRQGALASKATTLAGLANPKFSFSNLSPIGSAPVTDPTAALTAEMTARANGAAQPATMGAYSSSAATGASSRASEFAATHGVADNTGAQIGAAGQGAKELTGLLGGFLTPGAGTAGDSLRGTNNNGTDGFGNTLGGEKLSGNWQTTMNRGY